MSVIQWVLIISAIVYIFLASLAFKFPRGRGDWQKDQKETFFLAMSITVFLMLFLLLWYASAVIDWPELMTVVTWSAALLLVGLVIIGIFIPAGIRLSFGKKDKKKVDDEE